MIAAKIRDLLFPQSCLLCSNRQAGPIGICHSCLDDMPWHIDNVCPQCALPSVSNHLCGRCLQKPPAFDATLSLFQYQYPVSAMLQQYKYGQMLTLAQTWGEILAMRIGERVLPDRIIPMPLHKKRLQERGFNQSMEIARTLSRHLNVPLDISSCMRTRFTPPQASLPYKERIRNMHDAFSCEQNLQGLRIALLDDVMTTGASLNALAKTVKSAGASHVECWIIARTFTP
ncbi:ComF family protein [Methylobacillus caricis]|uniref:ComF family protein n=1 Tax=Methylobacillus caricis TaxID=1971611 RepID=UPI001CFFA6BA|nr:ComF family protein [Methylobacillus caricis]MCB5188494.1 ComF family protein [Methylobacillus caricis]